LVLLVGSMPMPVRQVVLLLVLFGLCLAMVGIAWITGSELYLFFPSRHMHGPPTHPGIIFGLLVVSPILTYWFLQNGVYLFITMALWMLLGSVMGFFIFGWTPSWSQHCVTAAMIATGVYAWNQKSYFEE
jgi:hypothetical protein